MAGIDRQTFGVMRDNWEHTQQSARALFTTRIGSRIMRRAVGSAVPAMLGRSMTESTVLRFKTAIVVAFELFEPRFAIDLVAKFSKPSSGSNNTPESMRLGGLAFEAIGEYRPRGHLGDPTPDTLTRSIVIG